MLLGGLSSLHVDIQNRTHETNSEIFEVESVSCVTVTVENYPRQAHIVQDEVAGVYHAREQVLDACPRLAARGRAILFPVVVKGRRNTVIVQTKVLPDPFPDAIRILTHVQRNRKTRGQ